jgi:hypothetical protein
MDVMDPYDAALDAHLDDVSLEAKINARWWVDYASDDVWWRTTDAGGVEQHGKRAGWTNEFRRSA